MKNKREIIKIPTKASFIVAIVLIITFIAIIIISEKSRRPSVVSFFTELKPAYITRPQNRGGIYISDTLVIHSSSKLLHKPGGFDEWNNDGPLIDFDTIPYIFTLGDLKTPYYISKKKDNDTIIVNKNGDTLLFLMYRPD